MYWAEKRRLGYEKVRKKILVAIDFTNLMKTNRTDPKSAIRPAWAGYQQLGSTDLMEFTENFGVLEFCSRGAVVYYSIYLDTKIALTNDQTGKKKLKNITVSQSS